MGAGIVLFMTIIVPMGITLANSENATVTIVSDQDLPIEFTLSGYEGFYDGPLLLDCRIVVKNGVGTFVKGSRNTMNYYGFPPSPFTRVSRRVVVEKVDADGRVLSRQESRIGNVLSFGFSDDNNAIGRERFFVRKQ